MGKTCTKCKTEKVITEYYKHKNGKDGLNPVCKPCWKLQTKEYEEENPKDNYRKKRYEENKTEINKKQSAYNLKRYHSNVEFRLIQNTRSRILNFLKGKHKSQSTEEILGIDSKGYKKYIEDLFTEGMNWDNYGKWEIDHVIPVSKGGSFHYKNTQPLWLKENRKKSNKVGEAQ